ncbi:MAG: C2H2-type zinc finger protein, partial [Candidatus Heimdallarchaeota archaeon]|nr:C2H2-type zinc finger protein [Candidatus Heimdallarchaeota archaeon]MCK4877099.1 C2H2-type zinc finger protein [Candidatus Heimdallarchaeota archaeon]
LPGIEQITQFELEELDSLDVDDHIISSFVDRAISSSASGLEVVFSDLLSLQNNPLLIDKIYSMLMRRLLKSREVSPEIKIADMVTYLSAHKPEYYKGKLEKLLEDTINAKEEKEFYNYLKTTSLVVKSSLLIASDIIGEFISKFIATEDIYTLDRLKRIINVFAITDPDILQLVCKVLVELYNAELEKEEINENIIDRAFAFLSLFDGVSVGTSLIFHDSDKIRDSFLEKLNKMNFQDSFKQIVSNIIEKYKEGTYEELLETLQGRELPEAIELEMLKKKYISSLSKVGSIPLELFAERIGQPLEQTEKIIYDMILKEEIPARIELVDGRLYIVQDDGKEELSEEIVEEELEETKGKIKKEKEIEVKPSEEKIENEYTCPQCDRKFSSERGLKMHISRSHKEK